MIEERQVDVAECDGCHRITYSEDGMFTGYKGTVFPLDHGGYGTTDWYACRLRCVGTAARNSLARSMKQESPQ